MSGVAGLAFAAEFKTWVAGTLGPGMSSALMAEALLAIVAFGLPTIMMGALFSHLATTARAEGVSFGRILGVNTVGAALAPVLCGVLLLSGLGTTYSLLLISAGYLLLASRQAWTTAPQLAATAAGVALAVWAPSLAFVQLPEGGRLARYAEGVGASISVIIDARGVATLHINNRQQEGSSATLLADARQGLLPILLHPAPRRALFLGLGTGVTSRSAAEDANLRVDAVELLPEVISASADFSAVVSERENPRLRLLPADARRFVRTAPDSYDVIVADNFHPARSGSGALYTVEHFVAVRERLMAGGVFCQWLPLHQLDLPTLRSVLRSYTSVYPRAWAMLATNSLHTPVLGLVARRDGERIDVGAVRERLRSLQMPRSAAEFGIADDLALLGSFIAGPTSLAKFAGGAPLNTDDHSVVSYLAPRITYAPTSAPRERLFELLPTSTAIPRSCWPRRPKPTGAGGSWPTGRRVISTSCPGGTCIRRQMCMRCWRRFASRCSPCCESARTFARRTTHCCRWPVRWRAATPWVRAICSRSSWSNSPRGQRPPRRCVLFRDLRAIPLVLLADS